MPNSDSIKAVGRFRFLLYTSIFSAFFPIVSSLYDKHSQPQVDAIRGLTVCLLASLWGYSIRGRLHDAGLPRWYSWPYFFLLLQIFLVGPHFFKFQSNLFSALLFIAVQIPTVFLRSRQVNADSLLKGESGEVVSDAAKPKTSIYVGRFWFFLDIVLFSAVWNYLTVSEDIWIFPWAMVFVFMLLLGVWALCLSGRFEDAGLPSHLLWPYVFVLLLTLELPSWFKTIDTVTSLFVFALLQAPMVYFRSKPRPVLTLPKITTDEEMMDGASPDNQRNDRENARRRVLRRPINRSRFSWGLAIIAFFWLFLINMDDISHRGVGTWIARSGYAALGFFWFGFVVGRFRDADLRQNNYPFLFCIVIAMISLIPFEFRKVNGYEALGIFVLVQLPILLLRSKPQPEESLPESSNPDEGTGEPVPLVER